VREKGFQVCSGFHGDMQLGVKEGNYLKGVRSKVKRRTSWVHRIEGMRISVGGRVDEFEEGVGRLEGGRKIVAEKFWEVGLRGREGGEGDFLSERPGTGWGWCSR